MFLLRDLHFVHCSRDLDVQYYIVCVQRIVGFFILLPTNQRGRKITWLYVNKVRLCVWRDHLGEDSLLLVISWVKIVYHLPIR